MKAHHNEVIRDDRAIVNVIALLLAMAFTIALSSLFVQVSHTIFVSTTQTVPTGVVSVTPQGIIIHNPYPVSVKLSEIKVLVNGKPVKLSVKQGGDTWGPYEDLVVPIPRDKNVVSIEVIYDGKLIYSGVYIKPSAVKMDRQFPKINAKATVNQGNGYVVVNATASDDTLVKAVEVYFGTVNGTLMPAHLSIKPDKSPEWRCRGKECPPAIRCRCSCRWQDRFRRAEVTVTYNPATTGNAIRFVVVKAMDCKGHVTQKVLFVKTVGPKIVWNGVTVLSSYAALASPNKVVSLYPSVNVRIQFTVEKGSAYLQVVKYRVDDGSWVNVSASNRASVSVSSPVTIVGFGIHTVTVYAKDVAGQTTTRDAVIEIVQDTGPSVSIVSPPNNAVIQTTSGRATVQVTISVKPLDGTGVKSVTATLDGSPLTLNESEGVWTAVVTVTQGTHTISATAVDTLGATGSATSSFVVFYTPVILPIPTTPVVNNTGSSNSGGNSRPAVAGPPKIVAASVPIIHWQVNFTRIHGIVPVIGERIMGGGRP